MKNKPGTGFKSVPAKSKCNGKSDTRAEDPSPTDKSPSMGNSRNRTIPIQILPDSKIVGVYQYHPSSAARLQCEDMTQMGFPVQMPQEGDNLVFSSALFQRPDDEKNPRQRRRRWGPS